jgi:hypothetical protein
MIVFVIIVLVVSVALSLSPVCRPWWREILLGLRAGIIETPLRAATGRKRMTAADYRHLRELEIELGWHKAPPKPKSAGGLTMAEFGERLRQFGRQEQEPATGFNEAIAWITTKEDQDGDRERP